ncbi:MAG TPA: GNAT family N-acetyltransferase [Methylomirabilota bacterium]|nr:GNAT family N-acetyltransferase [Methylomirabilota bacterium]
MPSEHAALTALAWRSKAFWGYSADQMETWREALTIKEEELRVQPSFLAEVHNEVAGFYLLSQSNNMLWLDHLWVEPTFMRQGCGRALVTHACAVAGASGAKELHVASDPNAAPFYQRLGAAAIGHIPPGANSGRALPHLVFVLGASE